MTKEDRKELFVSFLMILGMIFLIALVIHMM